MSIAQQRIGLEEVIKRILEINRIEARALKAQGYSNGEIAAKLGLHEGAVLNLLK